MRFEIAETQSDKGFRIKVHEGYLPERSKIVLSREARYDSSWTRGLGVVDKN